MAFLSQSILVLAILLSAYSQSNLQSSDGSFSESAYSSLVHRLNTQQAEIDELKRLAMQSPFICHGQVPADEFKPYTSSVGLIIQVNTAHCQFSTTPTYLTSLGGMNSIWYINGATAIYNATYTGFRVYLGTGDGIKSSEELLKYAKKRGWVLNWTGLEKVF
ncbi:hypothetical protein I4U23_023173 [Adineta vaga]|nr:hypothetical protein I4U23_023173 [Adineta vaga]